MEPRELDGVKRVGGRHQAHMAERRVSVETQRGLIEGVDTVEERLQTGWSDGQARCERMEPKNRGGHGGFKGMGQSDEPRVGRADGERPSQRTAHEEEIDRRLKELQGRQAAGKLNALGGPGVEIEVEV
jgi:hypothetical protein